jgi:Flp pilus assembly protein TadG
MNMRRKGRLRKRTRAAALVEFAVVAPLLLTLLFGIIEYGYVFLVRQTVVHAAREGCRVAVLQSTTDPYTEVTDRVADIMSSVGITNYTVTMTHATLANPEELVRISVPMSEVSLVGCIIPHSASEVVGAASMRKEGAAAASGG